jgi:hypothetical protein
VNGSVDLEGNSYRVGLSEVYGLTKVCSGNSKGEVRCSPDEYLIANGEAVKGKGFLRTDDAEVDDADEKPRDRIVNDGIRGLLFGSTGSGRSEVCPGSLVGRIERVSRSGGSEA